MPKGDDDLSLDFDELTRDRFLFGSPDEVTEQAELQSREAS